MRRAIDLNADVGEGFDGDVAVLESVTSASVACGFHAGDETTMRAACAAAVAGDVAIGAHVGYRDRAGFGRRELDVDAATVEVEVAEQIAALVACAAAEGGQVAYVKPHGALYHRAVIDPDCAAAIVAAVGATGDRLAVLAFPGSQLLALARDGGLLAVGEAFADRSYARGGGSLVARREAGAVLDEDGAVRQALSIALDGLVTTAGGDRASLDARSICLHGDSPGAPALARRVRAALAAAGIDVCAFA